MLTQLFIILSVVALAFAEKSFLRRLDDCGDQDVAVDTCNIHLHVCGGWYSWEWKYTGSGTEPVSGKTADAGGHYSSSTGAGEHATFNTLALLGLDDQDHYDCNCQAQDIQQKKCNLRIAVCFYFDTVDNMNSASPLFKAYAYDMNDPSREADTSGYTNATEAGTAAATELFQLYPQTAIQCGQTPQINMNFKL